MNNFYIHIEEQYWVFKCNNCPIIPMDDCVTGTYTIYQPIERLPPTAAKPTAIQNSAAIIAEIQVHATTLYHCIFYDCTLHSTLFMVKIIFFNFKIDWVNLTNERFDPNVEKWPHILYQSCVVVLWAPSNFKACLVIFHHYV